MSAQMYTVPQPLNGRPGHEDRTFQRVLHLAVQSPSDGGKKAVLRFVNFRPRVHEEETARAVSILRHARREAILPILLQIYFGDNGKATH